MMEALPYGSSHWIESDPAVAIAVLLGTASARMKPVAPSVTIKNSVSYAGGLANVRGVDVDILFDACQLPFSCGRPGDGNRSGSPAFNALPDVVVRQMIEPKKLETISYGLDGSLTSAVTSFGVRGNTLVA